jgi:hypothetical protein
MKLGEVIARHARHLDSLLWFGVATLAFVVQDLVDRHRLGEHVVVRIDACVPVAEHGAVDQRLAAEVVEFGLEHLADDELSILLRLALQSPIAVGRVEIRHRPILRQPRHERVNDRLRCVELRDADACVLEADNRCSVVEQLAPLVDPLARAIAAVVRVGLLLQSLRVIDELVVNVRVVDREPRPPAIGFWFRVRNVVADDLRFAVLN